jgi:hypothetical protein
MPPVSPQLKYPLVLGGGGFKTLKQKINETCRINNDFQQRQN